MEASPVRFDDGAGYDCAMGRWSILAGDVFLDWLALPVGLRWLDVGCGNGAFTRRIAASAGPASVEAIDPFEGQLAFARSLAAASHVRYRLGDARALPWPDAAFDVAAMALVLSFVPEPEKAVAEMKRVVRPGGTVAAYSWDELGGGYPYERVASKLRAIGVALPDPPSGGVSRIPALRALWQDAGLVEIETRTIAARRVFADFDDFWASARLSASMGPAISAMPPDERERLEAQLRSRLPADASGRVALGARANAIRGRVPG